MQLPSDRIYAKRSCRDIDELLICGCHLVIFQNSNHRCRITIYNLSSGEIETIVMKNKYCFNACSDGSRIAFEISGERRGIGILYFPNRIVELDVKFGPFYTLGGLCGDDIILRCGTDILIYNMFNCIGRIIASSLHIIGQPVFSQSGCAWIQTYRDKTIIHVYEADRNKKIIFAPKGHVNKLLIIGEYLIYQSCCSGICSINIFNINECSIIRSIESVNWLELYSGTGGTVTWTERKKVEDKYLFDIWVYNIYTNKLVKTIQNCSNAVIPSSSCGLVFWSDAKADGDHLNIVDTEI